MNVKAVGLPVDVGQLDSETDAQAFQQLVLDTLHTTRYDVVLLTVGATLVVQNVGGREAQ